MLLLGGIYISTAIKHALIRRHRHALYREIRYVVISLLSLKSFWFRIIWVYVGCCTLTKFVKILFYGPCHSFCGVPICITPKKLWLCTCFLVSCKNKRNYVTLVREQFEAYLGAVFITTMHLLKIYDYDV
jgi:hypothetical protein